MIRHIDLAVLKALKEGRILNPENVCPRCGGPKKPKSPTCGCTNWPRRG